MDTYWSVISERARSYQFLLELTDFLRSLILKLDYLTPLRQREIIRRKKHYGHLLECH